MLHTKHLEDHDYKEDLKDSSLSSFLLHRHPDTQRKIRHRNLRLLPSPLPLRRHPSKMYPKTAIVSALVFLFAGQAMSEDMNPMTAADPYAACNCPGNCLKREGNKCRYYSSPLRHIIYLGHCQKVKGTKVCVRLSPGSAAEQDEIDVGSAAEQNGTEENGN
ncbi:hypothetical protein F5Y00DRAFT_230123 [Daldinia vernicosa]|uniref:uncharacterized protein n=1 Tax=Daldinia vernicosa TaxID=114800 RepID=UPI00200863BE|nr:uncharacterized protein F5Y00DRAFT_230123 [Daldinia vernicosa]KAI0851567.1 hypothetical protein F5Y00DRAFT_230123 [Daldinia vernicosa]